jgi:hypothetical protein
MAKYVTDHELMSKWVTVNPGNGSDKAIIQAAKAWLTNEANSKVIEALQNAKPQELGVHGFVLPKLSANELANMTQDVINILEKNGWVQGTLYRDGKACLLGAAGLSLNANANSRMTGLELDENIKVQAWAREISTFFGWKSVEDWNDTRGRTFDEVIDNLRDFLYELKGR